MYTVPFTNMAISLSGGGYRATAFHLGALSLLDSIELNMDQDPEEKPIEAGRTLLKHVKILSTISGGTLTGVMYALKLAEGEDFKACYYSLYKKLSKDDLVTKALGKLNSSTGKWKNSHKTRNLINAFSEVYNEDFFVTKKGEGATFQTLSDAYQIPEDDKKPHLTDIIFGTTEFTNGNIFRFQYSKKGQFGGDNLTLTRAKSKLNAFKKIRLSDAAAASSCFPGGFEPMVMPTDFSNGPGSELDIEWRYGSNVATRLNKFHKACLKQAIIAGEDTPEDDKGFPKLKKRYLRTRKAILEVLQEAFDRVPEKQLDKKNITNLERYFQDIVTELCFKSPLMKPEELTNEERSALVKDKDLRNFRRLLQYSWRVKKGQDLNKAVKKVVDNLQDKPTTGIMDGGILDNQGLDAVVKAEARYFNKSGKSFIGTSIVSDVASGDMVPYQVPRPKPNKFKDFFTLNRVNLLVIACVAIVAGLLLKNGGAGFWGAVGATIVLTAAFIWFVLFFFIRLTIRKQITETLLGENPERDITEDKKRIVKDLNFFLKTPIYTLLYLIEFRATSAIKMITDLFLRRIRTLQNNSMFAPNMTWENRIVFNNIYRLKAEYPPSTEENMNHTIGNIVAAANAMPTTLWFTDKEQKENTALRDLIACGQLTLCKNLIEYLEDFCSKNEEGVLEFTELGKSLSTHHKGQLQRLNEQLLDFWGGFEKNGHWLVDQYGVKA